METYNQLRDEQQVLRRRMSLKDSQASEALDHGCQTLPASESMKFEVAEFKRLSHEIRKAFSANRVEVDMTRRLVEIDQQIKNVLTGLQNCQSVKQDAAVRAWVQDRLMETQLELKRAKRWRSSDVHLQKST